MGSGIRKTAIDSIVSTARHWEGLLLQEWSELCIRGSRSSCWDFSRIGMWFFLFFHAVLHMENVFCVNRHTMRRAYWCVVTVLLILSWLGLGPHLVDTWPSIMSSTPIPPLQYARHEVSPFAQNSFFHSHESNCVVISILLLDHVARSDRSPSNTFFH